MVKRVSALKLHLLGKKVRVVVNKINCKNMWSLKKLFFALFLSIIFISLTNAQSIEWMFPKTFEEKPRLVRRDRPCLINAGLSQGCDLSDMMFAKFQAGKFSSFAGPGK